MAKKSNIAALFVLAVLFSFFITSCSEDGGTEPQTGDLATVVTGDVTQIAATTAEGAGEVTDEGGDDVTGRGLCWSTDPDPTVSDSRVSAGKGLGSFSGQLVGLMPGTTYHLRAYAANSYGTAYGEDISFTTTSDVGTVTDIDGNVYHTVEVGNQIWMVENLKVTRFMDGAPVANVLSEDWEVYSGAAYCDYLDNPDWTVDYGRLYNWAAVVDPKGLAPDGWRVADDHDWKVLETTLGMLTAEAELLNWRGTDEGGKLKDAKDAFFEITVEDVASICFFEVEFGHGKHADSRVSFFPSRSQVERGDAYSGTFYARFDPRLIRPRKKLMGWIKLRHLRGTVTSPEEAEQVLGGFRGLRIVTKR